MSDRTQPYPRYRVRIRRDLGMAVRAEAESTDGKIYRFRHGWEITEEDGGRYVGEWAMIAVHDDIEYPYPTEAPVWVASGDLEPVDAH